MHFCADELLAITMALPFIGSFIAVARARWRRWRKRESLPQELAAQHHKNCIASSLGCGCTCAEHYAYDKERRQRRDMKCERERSYRGRT